MFISARASAAAVFETGPEVLEEFQRRWEFAGDFARPCGEQNSLDLKGINRRQLEDAGIQKKHITASSHCTCCEPDLFCPYGEKAGLIAEWARVCVCCRTRESVPGYDAD